MGIRVGNPEWKTQRWRAANFGARLREVRGTRTQAEFARMMGVSLNTLGRFECGERVPSCLHLMRLFQLGLDGHYVALGARTCMDAMQRTPAAGTVLNPAAARQKRLGFALIDARDLEAKALGEDLIQQAQLRRRIAARQKRLGG